MKKKKKTHIKLSSLSKPYVALPLSTTTKTSSQCIARTPTQGMQFILNNNNLLLILLLAEKWAPTYSFIYLSIVNNCIIIVSHLIISFFMKITSIETHFVVSNVFFEKVVVSNDIWRNPIKWPEICIFNWEQLIII